ncbi:DUF397 domain-containing protein [Streptomyces sp. SID3343]|uniref:DUF397 domain-containing protein n=1 Tax=Streptomyces sp. SID3343 TaxID=2690260 RepID=UPI0031F737E6
MQRLDSATWRKSTHSNAEGGNCVEAAGGIPSAVPVRDSKDPGAGHLVVPSASWIALTASLRA